MENQNTDSKPKPMREAMPQTAAFVDGLREAFGKEVIDKAMRDGGLYAEENGHVVGVKPSTTEFWYER